MKKFIESVPAGGAPIHAQELVSDVLSKEVWTATEAILGSMTPSGYNALWPNDNMVLSGGVVSPNASNFDVTAGIAYFKTSGGIIAQFPAVTNLPSDGGGLLYIELQSPIVETETYFDTSTQDYTTTYNAVVKTTSALPDVVVGYVDGGNTLPFASVQEVIKIADQRATGDMVMKRIALPAWNMNFSVAGQQSILVNWTGAPADPETKIVSITAAIRDDAPGDNVQMITHPNITTEIPSGGCGFVGGPSNTISLTLNTGSLFDSATWDGAVSSRGWIVVWYIE